MTDREISTPARPGSTQQTGAIVRDWWRRLQGADSPRGPDRAALAALRRCDAPMDALWVPAYHGLRRRLPARNPDRIAVAAAVLAHVREDAGPEPFARRLGPRGRDEDSAPMSYGRFRSLLQAETPEEVMRAMSRAVALLRGRANVADLGAGLIYWNDATRRRWAFAYFDTDAPGEHPAADPALPPNNDNEDRS